MHASSLKRSSSNTVPAESAAQASIELTEQPRTSFYARPPSPLPRPGHARSSSSDSEASVAIEMPPLGTRTNVVNVANEDVFRPDPIRSSRTLFTGPPPVQPPSPQRHSNRTVLFGMPRWINTAACVFALGFLGVVAAVIAISVIVCKKIGGTYCTNNSGDSSSGSVGFQNGGAPSAGFPVGDSGSSVPSFDRAT